ncbi:MAG: DUF6132 family protein [Endomicrobiia bacterium]
MDKNIIIKALVGFIVGGILGFTINKLNKFFCITGACPLTSNTWISIIYWALLGLVFSLMNK